MAKKRAVAKRHKSKHHGRRVGAVKSGGWENDIMESIGNGLGQIGATLVQRNLHSMDPKIVSGVQLVGGIMLKRHFDHPIMKGIGWGMNGAGIMGIAHETGVIHGMEDMVDKFFDGNGGGTMQEQKNIRLDAPGAQQGRLPDMTGGINNFDNLSGINNFTAMSGGEESMSPMLEKEYEGVKSLGW